MIETFGKLKMWLIELNKSGPPNLRRITIYKVCPDPYLNSNEHCFGLKFIRLAIHKKILIFNQIIFLNATRRVGYDIQN